ncbi:MAG TPA: ABC transporter substrate-binding protein [Dongiaceae bacterium]|jgi:multiple sugar transport system substrate-binding protein|nr:ABC transporter substrate-binding protein [Dongiaceae bacterium]
MHKSLTALAGAALALMLGAQIAQAQVIFWANQAVPVEEAQKMRDNVLKSFPGGADFQPQDPGPFITRIQAEEQAGKGTIGIVGALHGDLASFTNDWIDLSDIDLGAVKPSPAFMQLGKLGTTEQKYLPWMQANYVMVANKQALQYLPAGADINKLTYDQLIDWAKTMAEKTGGPKFGFPAGPKGLKHRFFQGFLLPAYTGSEVSKFRSADAETAWNKFKELWQYTNPASTNYDFMQEPLLSGDVWVAFDHIARLGQAFDQKPDDFVAFPAPTGPKGLAFMPVLAGLAIPKWTPDVAKAKDLVKYMMQPDQQVATLLATTFFPVTDAPLPADLPNSAKALGAAVAAQASSPDALPALLPVGLGDKGGQFNQVYIDTFERIVLNGEDVKSVLDSEADTLRQLMIDAKAPCWLPDADSKGQPCPVE